MPKKSKTLCVDDLRHAEYYGMQGTFDELYQKSQNGEVFENLMDLILSRDNILLAYRNIKANKGSYTAGTDKKNITDIGSQTPDDVVKRVRFIVTGSEHGYRPKPVRRKDIPKPNGKTRPLGIPCIWDRLIQQCIKQIMEPICEAKFCNNSYGFRPNRSVEHAINRTYTMLQMMNLHYVIEFDIKGFFDNVNHSKLIRQIWSLGIHDKTLIFIIKRILTAPIKMPDNTTVLPNKGTPQGGIISPLLANIVLNELDWWIASQWEENPIAISRGRERIIGKTKVFDKSHGYRIMKNTEMKEMHIIRYADDFRIFCRTKEDAVRTKEAVTAWIEERLKLEVSPEKTRIVNTRKRWSEFLGFKIRVRLKHHKYVVQSAICDKKVEIERAKLVEQAKNIAKPREKKSCLSEIQLYNSMVLGIQNYYQLATCISIDCRELHRRVMTVLTNRLNTETGSINYSEDDNPVALKADFILSLCELIVGSKDGLQPVEKTVIDRCVHQIYQRYFDDPKPENMPILEDLYNALLKQEEKEAHHVATALEIYVKGSLKVFNHRTNVDIQNRLVCYDIKELGNQLKKIGMLVVQDQVWGRVTQNRNAGKSTRYYIDEFHLLLKEEQTATYSIEIWKRFRKWGGIPTGITQNVKDLLRSPEIANILENSDFIYMLNQASEDRTILAQRLNISPHQLSYVTNSGEGEGLLFYGNVILPFVDRFPKDIELYRIMTTKLSEVSKEKEG